jgi:hypothetical protein
MAVDVYHKKSFRELVKHPRDTMGIRAMFDAQENAQWPGDYDHVATVESDDREDAFELTNSIDSNWWVNVGVTPHGAAAKGCRSTSVGDIVVLGNGEAWKCAGCGWDRIEQIEVA